MFIDRQIIQYTGWMLCLIALTSINLFCLLPVSNTLIYYISTYSTIAISCYYLFKNKYYLRSEYIGVCLYLLWTVVCIFRGVMEVESYWVFNQLIRGTMAILVPIVIFFFANPVRCIRSMRILNIFIASVGLFLLGWALPIRAYAFFACPFFLMYICFLCEMDVKWRYITLISVALVFVAIDNRSGILKVAFSLMVFMTVFLPKSLRGFVLKTMHWACYMVALVLLLLGLTGQYNFFSPVTNDATFTSTVIYHGENEENIANYSVDTRTFLYVEAIESAFTHDHLWSGATPAHGYSSPYFADVLNASEDRQGTFENERFMSEVGNLNIFTWEGIIGCILVLIMYLCGATLALYRSNNRYVKMLACIVSFQWTVGWIENPYQFHLLDVTVFMIMGICYSSEFRRMSDAMFRLFISDLFAKPSAISKLQLLQMIRLYKAVKMVR